MNLPHNKSVTLLELLIAITLISLIVLGFSSIDLFSRYHVVTSDRRAKLQNEVSHALEHMTKQISMAIGNERIFGVGTVIDRTDIGGDSAIRIYIDANANGQSDSSDSWIAYRFTGNTGNPNTQFQIWFYSNYTNPSSSYEVIATKITSDFSNTYVSYDNTDTDGDPIDNYMDIQLTACWDPDGSPQACGTPDNPSVTMSTRIKMPSVSTN